MGELSAPMHACSSPILLSFCMPRRWPFIPVSGVAHFMEPAAQAGSVNLRMAA
jgi:hypothetical protein